MSLSVTPLFAAVPAVELFPPTSTSTSTSTAGGAANSSPGSNSTASAQASSSNSASEPPRPPISQQIQDLYNQGESVTDIAVQLYTTVSVVNTALDLSTSTLQVGANVQLTA